MIKLWETEPPQRKRNTGPTEWEGKKYVRGLMDELHDRVLDPNMLINFASATLSEPANSYHQKINCKFRK